MTIRAIDSKHVPRRNDHRGLRRGHFEILSQQFVNCKQEAWNDARSRRTQVEPRTFQRWCHWLMNKVPQVAFVSVWTSRFATRFIIFRLVFTIKYLPQDAPWIAIRLIQEPYYRQKQDNLLLLGDMRAEFVPALMFLLFSLVSLCINVTANQGRLYILSFFLPNVRPNVVHWKGILCCIWRLCHLVT